MTRCQGTYLDRLCRELENRECTNLLSRKLRLGMDIQSSSILYDTDINIVAIHLEPAEGSSGEDVMQTIALDAGATETMLALVTLTLADLVAHASTDELLAEMILHARTQWHCHKPSITLPPFEILVNVLSGITLDTLELFGSVPLQIFCRCTALGYESLSSDEYRLCDLLSDQEVRLAYLVAIGQSHPSKPLL